MHRKGSTRAFPPHHPLIPVDYQVSMMSTRFESFTFIPTKHTRLLGLVIKCGCVQIGLEESKHYQIELKRITTNKQTNKKKNNKTNKQTGKHTDKRSKQTNRRNNLSEALYYFLDAFRLFVFTNMLFAQISPTASFQCTK